MSFVTRKGAGVGEGEGRGVGEGVGDGPWARADARFSLGVASAAAPSAGTSFTNVRRFKLMVSDPDDFWARFFFDSGFFIVLSVPRIPAR